MLATVIAAATLLLLIREMLREPAAYPLPLWLRVARWAPFTVVALLSIYAAGRAPRGRKPFQMDWSLSGEDLLRSMTKVPHVRSIAVIILLAALAFGVRRLLLAFAATMLVGITWEVAQTTVIGHHARIADLAPNLVAGVVTLLLLLTIRAFCDRATGRGSPFGGAS